jgi:putative ABC transport system permease protein
MIPPTVFRRIETLRQNLRYALRALRNDPAFAVTAVLTLALGIGINTTVFSVINAILIRPMPGIHAERVVALRDVQLSQHQEGDASYPDVADWKAGSSSLADVAAYHDRDVVMIRPGSDAEQIQAEAISTNLFQMLGARPAMGRLFFQQEGVPGNDRVLLLSYKLWTERFAGRPDAVGSKVIIDGQPRTVVGVMPPHFGFPDNQVMWVPIAPTLSGAPRGSRYLRVLGKLKSGSSVAAAQQDLNSVAARLARMYPETDAGHGVRVVDFGELNTGGLKPVLLIMLGAVGLVLLIACGNLATIFLARAAGRQQEIAVRMALGARRSQVVGQLLTESVVIALLGGVVGVGVAYAGLRLIVAALPFEMPLWLVFDIDSHVLLFTLIISIGTGVVFGLAPALGAGRADLTSTLRDGRRGVSMSRPQRRMRSALVVLELALATVLLTGAMLMVRSLIQLQHVDPGFDPAPVLTAEVPATGPRYDDKAVRDQLYTQLAEQAATLPGATSAAVVSRLPLTGGRKVRFEVEGHPLPNGERPTADYRGISAEYFHTVGVPVYRGRSITSHEVQADAPVVVVNAGMATKFWPGADPIGKQLRIGDRWLKVVGVVRDARLSSLDESPGSQVYGPFTDGTPASMNLMIRTRSAPAAAPGLRKLVRSTDPGIPLGEIVGLEEVLHRSLWRQRLFGGMFIAFAAIALVLAIAGVYGVMLHTVLQRTHEMAVRMALGADAGRVLRLIVGRATGLVLAGLLLGTLGAFALVRIMASLLYGVSPTDPEAFAGSIAVLGAASLLAAYLPARRATQLDPVVVLRAE